MQKNLPKDNSKKLDDKERERELKEEQDDETKRLLKDSKEDLSAENILSEYGFHRVIDEEEQVRPLHPMCTLCLRSIPGMPDHRIAHSAPFLD